MVKINQIVVMNVIVMLVPSYQLVNTPVEVEIDREPAGQTDKPHKAVSAQASHVHVGWAVKKTPTSPSKSAAPVVVDHSSNFEIKLPLIEINGSLMEVEFGADEGFGAIEGEHSKGTGNEEGK